MSELDFSLGRMPTVDKYTVAEPEEQKDTPMTTDKVPMLTRLVPHVITQNGDRKTQPVIGASLEVVDDHHSVKTIWFPAQVWAGVATLVRQTPDRQRESVAELLEVLHAELEFNEPVALFLLELINDVKHDPYGDLPHTPVDAFDASW